MVKLGQKVRDQITGFEGMVTGLVSYISGCNQALVAPRVKPDGEFAESHWFDLDRLAVTDPSEFSLSVTASGADLPAPRR